MNVFEFHSPIAEFLILTVILTFLLLLFGEIMPKIYSAQKTLSFCRFAASGISMFRSVFYPMESLLMRSSSFLNKHVSHKNHNISVDELSHALELTDKTEISEESNSESAVQDTEASETQTTEKTQQTWGSIGGYYTVKRGDTLAGISKKMYQSYNYIEMIAEANGIDNVDEIYPGQILEIPQIED